MTSPDQEPEAAHTLTLVFRNEREKRYIMGQLSDGFGENEMDLGRWREDGTATTATCTPIGDAWEHTKKLRREHPEYFE